MNIAIILCLGIAGWKEVIVGLIKAKGSDEKEFVGEITSCIYGPGQIKGALAEDGGLSLELTFFNSKHAGENAFTKYPLVFTGQKAVSEIAGGWRGPWVSRNREKQVVAEGHAIVAIT